MSPSVVPELQHWQPWECVRNAVPGPGLKLLNQNLHFIKIPCDQYVGQGFGHGLVLLLIFPNKCSIVSSLSTPCPQA